MINMCLNTGRFGLPCYGRSFLSRGAIIISLNPSSEKIAYLADKYAFLCCYKIETPQLRELRFFRKAALEGWECRVEFLEADPRAAPWVSLIVTLKGQGKKKKKTTAGKSEEVEAHSLFPLNYPNVATSNFSSFTFSVILGSFFILIPISP